MDSFGHYSSTPESPKYSNCPKVRKARAYFREI